MTLTDSMLRYRLDALFDAESHDAMTQDRRRIAPRTFIVIGMMIGIFTANPISVISQGSGLDLHAWSQPPVVMSLIGVMLSVGMAWQMLADYKRRLLTLESETVRREIFHETMKRIDGSLLDIRRDIQEHRSR